MKIINCALRGVFFAALTTVSALNSFALNEATIDRQAREIYDSFMSPFCPGLTISACASDQARELREEIRAMLKSGDTPGEIEAYLARRYGNNLLGDGGSSRSLGVLVPLGFVLLGLGILTVFIRAQASVQDPTEAVSPEIKAKIEAEVARHSGQDAE